MSKKVPRVLILGRPNVGKSTLINKIIRSRKAITLDEPGITRDIASFPAQWKGKHFLILDSAGIFAGDTDGIALQDKAEEAVKNAIEKSDKIIFLVDYKTGLHPLDKSIAMLLRTVDQKVVVGVNKCDDPTKAANVGEFYKLGFGEPIAVSSVHGLGIFELLDAAIEGIHYTQDLEDIYKTSYKISFVGRPNVGKSSLLNAITNDDHVLVDDIAGTTRDAVEVFFEYQDDKYVFVDTAGLRRKARVSENVEYYSVVRTNNAISAADLVVIVLEPEPFMTDQDKKVINQIVEQHKNAIVFVNKWDQTERTDQARKDMIAIARYYVPALEYYPFLFGSALDRINIGKLFKSIPEVIQSGEKRVSTAELNRFVERVVKQNPPPLKKGKRIKILYSTQADVSPPTFVFFVNQTTKVDKEYERFLSKRIRLNFGGFEGNGVCIKFKLKEPRKRRG